MFTSAFGNAITSGRIGSFLYSNGKEIQGSYVKIASGQSVSAPSDRVGDYFRSAEYSVKNKEYDGVTRSIDEATAMINYSEQANRMIWDDLHDMQALVKDYYNTATSVEEQNVLQLEFEELKSRITMTQKGASYDGRDVLSDSSADPLISINTNPHDLSQKFEVSFDADTVVDVLALDITVGENDAMDALEKEVEHAGGYGAQLTGYRYGLEAQRKLSQVTIEENGNTINTIQDVDEAQELFSLTKRTIQQQAATSMFAQSKMSKSNMLILVAAM